MTPPTSGVKLMGCSPRSRCLCRSIQPDTSDLQEPSINWQTPTPPAPDAANGGAGLFPLSSLLSLASPAITHALHSRLLGLASRCGRGALFTGSQPASRYSPKSPKPPNACPYRASFMSSARLTARRLENRDGRPSFQGSQNYHARGRNSMAPQFASLSTSRSFPNGSCNE
jgi:hypothetical protein